MVSEEKTEKVIGKEQLSLMSQRDEIPERATERGSEISSERG